MEEAKIPTDLFSRRRRELGDSPAALGSGSTVHLRDFYGNGESWIVETFRADGLTTVFLQRSSEAAPFRTMLPPEVMAAILRHCASIDARIRRRGARQAAATRKARGIEPAFRKGKK
jgi:hypothetical protein